MKLYKHLFLCFSFPLFLAGYASTPAEIDSLWKVAKNEETETGERIKALFTLHFEYDNENPPYCLQIVALAYDISKRNNYLSGTGIAKTMEANAKTYLTSKESALKYRFESISLLEKANEKFTPFFLSKAYRYLGSSLSDMGRKEEGMMFLKKAIKKAREDDDIVSYISVWYVISQEYRRQGKTTDAMNAVTEGLKIANEEKEHTVDHLLYIEQAEIYGVIKDAIKEKECIEKSYAALSNDRRGIRFAATLERIGKYYITHSDTVLCKIIGNRFDSLIEKDIHADIPVMRNNFYGNFLLAANRPEQALGYLINIINHTRTYTWGTGLTQSYIDLARCYNRLEKYPQTLAACDTALQLARKNGYKKLECDVLYLLFQTENNRKNTPAALTYLQAYTKLNEEFIKEDNRKKTVELETQYETLKKESKIAALQNENLEKEKKKNLFLLLAGLTLCIAAFTSLLLRQKQKANKQLVEKNEIINKQVQKLAELNSEKNNLISIVSHDLASPISNIGVWSQLLQRKDENLNEKQKEAVLQIIASSEQGHRLIKNILDVEKAQTGNHKLQLENTDVKHFAEQVSRDFRLIAEKKSIHLQCSTPNGSVWLLTDRNLLARICENLLSNAVKYSHSNSQIWFSVADNSNDVTIKVKDEGVGISKDDLDKLFTKYGSISAKPTGGEHSTGLGLSIVKRLVDELNGKIVAESEEGKGSTFTVILKK